MITTASRRVSATVVTGEGAHGVVGGAGGQRAYVANSFAGSVSVLDTTTDQAMATVPVGRGPNGITFGEQSEQLTTTPARLAPCPSAMPEEHP